MEPIASTPASDPHRHDDGQILRRRAFGRGSDHRGIELSAQSKHDFFVVDRTEHVEEIARIEADRHLVTVVFHGNLVETRKFVAAIGLGNLIAVETPDALLLCSRERAQDVGKVVHYLQKKKLKRLL